ncbi:rubrerythrin family protein [Candidatus Bathyarchaeota archaeon]|nr:rubrerythrin family protein [Candidatus Bathyarchaeota archaeon]
MSLKERTANNVHATFVEEAKAAVRLLLFAKRAESEGLPQIASLFRAVTVAEGIHAKKALCVIER